MEKSRSHIFPFTWNGTLQSSYAARRQQVQYVSKIQRYALLVTYGFALCDAVTWTSRHCFFCMYYIIRNVHQKFIRGVHIMLLCCSRPSCCQIWTKCDDSTEKQHKARTQTKSHVNTFIRPVTYRPFTGQGTWDWFLLQRSVLRWNFLKQQSNSITSAQRWWSFRAYVPPTFKNSLDLD